MIFPGVSSFPTLFERPVARCQLRLNDRPSWHYCIYDAAEMLGQSLIIGFQDASCMFTIQYSHYLSMPFSFFHSGLQSSGAHGCSRLRFREQDQNFPRHQQVVSPNGSVVPLLLVRPSNAHQNWTFQHGAKAVGKKHGEELLRSVVGI